MVALNRAVALAEVSGPAAGLAALAENPLPEYQFFQATRANFLARLGRTGEAAEAYRRALELTTNEAARKLLAEQLRALVP